MVVSRRGAPSQAPRATSVTETSGRILIGDCVALMGRLAADSVDLIFADPPYNLQLRGDLKRPDDSRVDAVDDDWDKFASFADYDAFTKDCFQPCRREPNQPGTTWGTGPNHTSSASARSCKTSASGSSMTWSGARPIRCRTSAAGASPMRTRL